MKRAAFLLTILAVLGLGIAGSQLVSTARAQSQPQGAAVCGMVGTLDTAKQAEVWMNKQIAAGRANFITVQDSVVCAW